MTFRTASLLLSAAGALVFAGCGGAPTAAPSRGAGAIHAIVQGVSGQTRGLSVDYAAAGVSATGDERAALVIVGVFRDGRVDESLDLETLSISVPLAELPAQSGAVDVVVEGSALNVLLEGSAASGTLLAPDAVEGVLHLRYDAPPRPGITLRGDFSLQIVTETAATVKLDGEFEVPVLGG